MSPEKLATLMNEARLLSACDNVIYPLLEHKIAQRLEQSCAKFRGGETDFIADIAYITGLKDIATELKTSQTQGLKAIEKLGKMNEGV